MPWCTALPRGRPGRCWPRSASGWPRSGSSCTRTRRKSSTARTATGGARTSTRRSRSWGSSSGAAACPREEREDIHLVPARGQQGCPEEDERGGAVTGGCTVAPAAPWASSPGRSTRSCAAGSVLRGFGLRELYPLLQRINYYLVRWLRKKYRRLRTWKRLRMCWERITSQYPAMFAHWYQVKWYWRTG